MPFPPPLPPLPPPGTERRGAPKIVRRTGPTNPLFRSVDSCAVHSSHPFPSPPTRTSLLNSGAFASYTAKTTSESLWAWVGEHDELLLEMRAGHVFADFSEGPIAFPPPFRWRRGKDAGDYTSVRRRYEG